MNPLKRFSKSISVLLASLMLTGFGAFLPWVDASQAGVPESFTELSKKVSPGVVNIRTVKTIKGGGRVFRHFFGDRFGDQFGGKNPFEDFFNLFPENDQGREFKQRSLGSGFIIDAEGYIVTNNHVIDNADQIIVRLPDEKEFDAELVGRDSNTDIALIRIKAPKNISFLKMGDSDALDVGSWVLAVGSPFGLEQTVTAGIVSAKGRVIGSGPYDDFIQTDASINPGNSGGPLVNMDGEVVGINTAIVSSGQGIGFAIPINLAQGIITQLKTQGEVTRGWLGVSIQDLSPELAEYYRISEKKGVLVTEVFKDDPADRAGIQAGDVIVAIDGKPVSTSRELSAMIANLPVGHGAKLSVVRKEERKTIEVKLAKRAETASRPARSQDQSDDWGLAVTELTPEIKRQFGFEKNETGILVTGVSGNSPAEKAGLQRGDLIKEMDHEPVPDIKTFTARMDKIQKDQSISLLIQRPREGFKVVTLTR